MITFESGGGLGNRLFQYVIARLIAERLGYKLGTQYRYNDTITATPYKVGKDYRSETVRVIEDVNTGNILEYPFEKKHYILQGFWQDASYYIPNRDKILGFFRERAPWETNVDDIVMHVRLGDYKCFGKYGTVLDPKYYTACLDRETFKKLYILTDYPGDRYFEEFKRYNPIIQKKTEKHDFWFMTEFDRIICGNSTFSWWAAFLSNAMKIYTPSCWIRNSYDIFHNLQYIDNGKTKQFMIEAGFVDYNKHGQRI